MKSIVWGRLIGLLAGAVALWWGDQLSQGHDPLVFWRGAVPPVLMAVAGFFTPRRRE